MTNKENNPPPVPSTSFAPPPEKPVRKDLLHERFTDLINQSAEAPSYVFQNTFSNDEDFAAINRLMSDFKLNRDSDHRSPLQMIADMRPSTILEESSVHTTNTEESKNIYAASTSSSSRDSFATVHRVVKRESALAKSKDYEVADDTLEEIEYIQTDDRLNYVPKRSILKNAARSDAENESNDVIVIDSSPETSFVTTGNGQSAETTGFSYFTAKTDQTSASKRYETTFYSQSEGASNVDSLCEEENAAKQLCSGSNLHTESETLCDNSVGDSASVSSSQREAPNARSSAFNRTSESADEMPEFNNTLERIEYMMERGQKILQRKAVGVGASSGYMNSPSRPAYVDSPSRPAPEKTNPKPSTPSKPSSAKKVDLFKKPMRSPMVLNRNADAQSSGSKIPKPSAARPKFRHIASPIAAYINNTPEVPLIRTVKPVRNLFESRPVNRFDSNHDESTCSVESMPVKPSLPRKFYTSAPQRQVIPVEFRLLISIHSFQDASFLVLQIIDSRYMVTPGGKSVQKLIGNVPLVIRHEGRYKSAAPPAERACPFEESLADLSHVSGDVSVQVVKDVHRKH